MTLRLGAPREALELVLFRGDDFIDTIQLRKADGTPLDWPTGTTAVLIIDDLAPWPALVDGSYLRWDVDSVVVDTVDDHATARLVLDYNDGRGPFTWAKGPVIWG